MNSVSSQRSRSTNGFGDHQASDDLYDFSDVSYDDLAIFKTDLFHMMKRSSTFPTHGDSSQFLLKNGGGSMSEDDEEWFPPTPPPYDVLDKLIEANLFLESDPTSSKRIPDRLRWRPDSRLVEIRWLGPEDNDNCLSPVSCEEIVILDGLQDLKLSNPTSSDSSLSDPGQTTTIRTNCNNNNNPVGSKDPGGEFAWKASDFLKDPPDSCSALSNAESSSTTSSSASTTLSKRVPLAPAKISPNLPSVSKSNNQTNSQKSSRSYPPPVPPPKRYSHNPKQPPQTSQMSRYSHPPTPLGPGTAGTGQRSSSASSSTRSSSLDRRSSSANNNNTTTSHNHNRKPLSRKDRISTSFSLPDLKGAENRSQGLKLVPGAPPQLPISRVICRSRSPLPNPRRTPILDRSQTKAGGTHLRPPPTLQRKMSRNSLSSSSSTSSHSTTGEDSVSSRREAADLAFEMWKQRKRQEKRLLERKNQLFVQSRSRHFY